MLGDNGMSSLFDFELMNVEDIEPWGTPEKPSMSWFALTYGTFRINVQDRILFQYTPEILEHWQGSTPYPDYQIAAFARDILGSFPYAVMPLPARIERLARDWTLLENLDELSNRLPDESTEDVYTAWRWLGERTPWHSYLQAEPKITYVRIGDDIEIHWDNSKRFIEGIQVWTAMQGTHRLHVDQFTRECHGFSERLLTAMKTRLKEIDAGTSIPRAAVDMASLWKEHATWQTEFERCLHKQAMPDITWTLTEAALCLVAAQCGVVLPESFQITRGLVRYGARQPSNKICPDPPISTESIH